MSELHLGLSLTPRSRAILQLAEAEARRLNHCYIGTEHLLLAIVREGEGIAAGVLASFGVNHEKVATATEFVIGRGDGPCP